jgi:hypothetical protein
MEEDLMTVESLAKTVIDITVEAWRFRNVFERLVLRLSPSERLRYAGQYAWFNRKINDSLNKCGIRIIDVKGKEFSADMPAIPVNIQEFNEDDVLVIDQMLEPIIMNGETILKTGSVVLKKKNIR